MDQVKIGKFIAECRKDKKLTQEELARRLGVNSRSVSRWENGICMPDLSLFNVLCKELDITVNELLSGERLNEKKYKKKSEENIINAINYGSKKVKEKNYFIGLLLIIFGVLVAFSAMAIFPSESSWGSIYSVLGGIISLVGVSKFTVRLSYFKRVLCNFLYFSAFIVLLFVVDYLGVVGFKQPPRFRLSAMTINNLIMYETPFYNVFRVNFDEDNEYYIIDYDKEYTYETVPNVPFDRDKSGIDNLLQYKMEHLSANIEVFNLIDDLPLAEEGLECIVNPNDKSLNITYNIDEYYMHDDYLYIERALIYNIVSLFTLIDDLDYIRINLLDRSYKITREQLLESFPNIRHIFQSDYDKSLFNDLLEAYITDDYFINTNFKYLFVDQNIARTKRIEVVVYKETIKKISEEESESVFEKVVGKVIIDKDDIASLVNIVARSEKYPKDTLFTSEGHSYEFVLYDDEDIKIATLYGWLYRSIGFSGKEYKIESDDVEKLKELATIK